jgi:hypothetical protein
MSHVFVRTRNSNGQIWGGDFTVKHSPNRPAAWAAVSNFQFIPISILTEKGNVFFIGLISFFVFLLFFFSNLADCWFFHIPTHTHSFTPLLTSCLLIHSLAHHSSVFGLQWWREALAQWGTRRWRWCMWCWRWAPLTWGEASRASALLASWSPLPSTPLPHSPTCPLHLPLVKQRWRQCEWIA